MRTKLVLLACVSILFASCKKEAVESIQPQSPKMSMDEQVADLIKRADKNLYNEVYNLGEPNQRASTIEVKIIHGVFVPQNGDIASGYCQPHLTNPCMIIITTGTSSVLGSDDTDVNVQFPVTNPAKLIINTAYPVVQKITAFSAVGNSNGGVNVSFKQ